MEGQKARLAVFVWGVCLICRGLSAAEGDENWDPNFGVPGVNGYVAAIALWGTNVYVGGIFTSVGGIAATNLARWNGREWSDVGGGLDTAYNGGVYPGVYALAVSSNALYVGGRFSRAGNLAISNIAKWNGTNWEALATGLNREVASLAVSGEHLYAGGGFTNAGATHVMHIAKWDGISWMSVGGGVKRTRQGEFGPIEDGNTYAIAISGSNVYVGGGFESAGSVSATNIAVWNGNNWSRLPGHLDDQVLGMKDATDGIYVAGQFRSVGVAATTGIAKWNGNNWASVGGGVDHFRTIDALCFAGTDLYVVGNFYQIGGVAARTVAKWDVQKWSALGSGIGGGGPVSIGCTGSEIIVGGAFRTAGGKPSTNIALWHIPHALNIKRKGDGVQLSWPATGSNFVLESSNSLNQTNWTNAGLTTVIHEDQCVATNSTAGQPSFFRLRHRDY